MKYENDFYCINYNECDKKYINDLIDALNSNLSRIMNFFKITGFNKKISINIWNNLDDYIAYLKPLVGEYHDWMVADTYDGRVNILSFDLYLSGAHRNSNISDYKRVLVHELVHSCQSEINPDASNVAWFWEALATNLSEQELMVIDIPYSKNDIINNYQALTDLYSVSYTIGKYLLECYGNSQILEYIKHPDKLLEDMDAILFETRKWVQIKQSKDCLRPEVSDMISFLSDL